jgi:lysyl-tRNA synthetase class 1
MDDIPSYLDRAKYEQYLGVPLYKIPSPVAGFDNFAAYYAQEFMDTFNADQYLKASFPGVCIL